MRKGFLGEIDSSYTEVNSVPIGPQDNSGRKAPLVQTLLQTENTEFRPGCSGLHPVRS